MEPFRQVENSHTRKYQGTGLGLPLVKALVELHGGEFRIESEPGSRHEDDGPAADPGDGIRSGVIGLFRCAPAKSQLISDFAVS